MVLSKREKYIGIGAISAVVLLGLNSFVVGPYEDRLEELRGELTSARHQIDANDKLLKEQKDLLPDWNAMLTNGLEADDSTAASRTQQMIQTWAQSANITPEALTPDHVNSQKGPFQTINFSLDFSTSGNDSMRQLARLLWSVETARIPMRLNNLRIQSTKEGTDQLNVKMVVSALYMPSTGTGAGGTGLDDFYDMEQAQ